MTFRLEGIASKCLRCGYELHNVVLPRCPRCGYNMIVALKEFEWRVDHDTPSMWRYRHMLPPVERVVSFSEGYTPLRRVKDRVLLKLENRNPTGSYADRASSLVASFIASTRNHPSMVTIPYTEDYTVSLSLYLRGITGVRVVADPRTVNPSDVIILDRLGVDIVFSSDATNLNNTSLLDYLSPLTIEGLKTIAYEIVEARPNSSRVIVPSETGLLALAIAKGFYEANMAGIDASYEVVAAAVEGSGEPELARYAPIKVKVEYVSSEEVVKALVELSRRGLRVKPLSAAAYAAALNLGEGVAVITSSLNPRHLGIARRPGSQLNNEIRRALQLHGEVTAYQLWLALGRTYSLRGIYKALETLEAEGIVCSRYVMKGRRRIKLYKLCT
ncbi:pyridoxal-phosphate dependent enzyme [Hyperthermus butylicus]|uniref:Conserved archaeal protein n=1 Tax=Hyperthermus butylicus (strain DSM 5456 / JCM 9403 / PLM1-5) TaxID=415426 RepID=A2BLL7_HYPBU|nr:pyridoxal-phosphate dependent enzyme [Hyperthermus butylicus]ABM80878.1 conserved archaeal protein [Hyperthermus butylicus DSM 5456]